MGEQYQSGPHCYLTPDSCWYDRRQDTYSRIWPFARDNLSPRARLYLTSAPLAFVLALTLVPVDNYQPAEGGFGLRHGVFLNPHSLHAHVILDFADVKFLHEFTNSKICSDVLNVSDLPKDQELKACANVRMKPRPVTQISGTIKSIWECSRKDGMN